jgi:hypothetical protein
LLAENFADPQTIGNRFTLGDRRLRLSGYDVYRLGAAELSDTTLSPLKVGPASQAVVSDFFDRLLRKHGIVTDR